MKFATKAIHVGQDPDPTTGAIIPPIYQTSTYVQEELGKHKGFVYARTANPTRSALQECLASLENGKYALCFASGQAAETNVMNLLSAGDHVIVGDDVYGGTYRLFERVLTRYGLTFTYVDARDVKNIEGAIKQNTKMVWLETPTNPLLRLVDIRAIADMARSKNLISVVDNTFASPYFQQPLQLGADIVVHSTTKYIGGHSDVVGGAVITSDDKIYESCKFNQNAIGGTPGPMDCWLTLRGIKTLALRMEAHNSNAMAVAEFLSHHKSVEKVIYPGLADHPQNELAREQMTGYGGMVSIVLHGSMDNTRQFLKSTKLFALAESLGGVESLVCHPATMTHAAVPKEEREARGFTDTLIRLSVGIEDSQDLIEDLDKALSTLTVLSSAI